MKVWFLASQSLPFTPRLRIEDQRVGGSETALFWIARGLARLGHDVVVLNHCHPDDGRYEGVRYLDVSAAETVWRNEGRTQPPDVLVLFRRMLDVLTDLPSKMRVFWAHDYQGVQVSDQPSLGRSLAIVWRRLTGPLFHGRVNQVFVVSQFMAYLFEWLFRMPPKKLVVMPNGVDVSLFQGPAPGRVPMKFVHSSVPNRGLAQLLRDIFPQIQAGPSPGRASRVLLSPTRCILALRDRRGEIPRLGVKGRADPCASGKFCNALSGQLRGNGRDFGS